MRQLPHERVRGIFHWGGDASRSTFKVSAESLGESVKT